MPLPLSLLSLSLFHCITNILLWLLELIASVQSSILGCPFSLFATSCLFVIIPLCSNWQLLLVHPEHLFNIIRMHDTIIISPFPESSMCLSLLSRTLISFLCMFTVASNPFSKWKLSQTFKSIPCGFKLFKLPHLLIAKSSFFCATCIYHCSS